MVGVLVLYISCFQGWELFFYKGEYFFQGCILLVIFVTFVFWWMGIEDYSQIFCMFYWVSYCEIYLGLMKVIFVYFNLVNLFVQGEKKLY